MDLSLGYSQLLKKYGPQNRVLEAVLGHAYALGAGTAMVEYRYIDQDYRSEHQRYYGTTFRRYPSVTERVLFFEGAPPKALSDPTTPASFEGLHLLGYSIMRPLAGSPVGRTLLRPSADLEPYVSCAVDDELHLFGQTLPLRGAPFMAQDAQLGSCAHTSAWLAAYYHHLKFGAPRFRSGEVADAIPPETGMSRPVPTRGLTMEQLLEGCRRLGLPPLVYPLRAISAPENLFRIACRYLNSGIPVITLAGSHAFVLVGYRRVRCQTEDERIHFIRQDDEVGPYQIVQDPYGEPGAAYRPWEYLVVPLPPRVHVTGEEAEAWGRKRLTRLLKGKGSALVKELESRSSSRLTFRTMLLRSTDFKARQVEREAPQLVAAAYTRMPLPRWIWLVELTDKDARDRGGPCVIGEAVIDPTNPSRDQQILAWRDPEEVGWWNPDHDEVTSFRLEGQPILKSLSLVDSKCPELR